MSELTENDLIIADDILDNLIEDPIRSLELYVKAKPRVKKMLGGVNPRELLMNVNPKIEVDKVMNYIDSRDSGDEIGMRRTYNSANPLTKQEIDILFK